MKKQRIEALRAERERRRAAQLRRRRLTFVAAPVAVVLAVAAVLVVGRLARGQSRDAGPVAAAQAALTRLAHVPMTDVPMTDVGASSPLPVAIKGRPPLTSGAKPKILYVGAEYCPYCAAERWPMIIALSRFGSFTGLRETRSSGVDVFPHTSTFSFRDARYTSPYLAFTAVETEDVNHKPLRRPAPQDQALFTALDAPPYVQDAGSIPFVDFGNRYAISGASYSPQVLAGLTQAKIAGEVSNPTGQVGRTVNGAANMITATICSITGNKPGAVCGAPAVRGIRLDGAR